MADLQDEIRKLEEERKKRITEEKRQQEIDAEKIRAATEDLTNKRIKAEEDLKKEILEGNKYLNGLEKSLADAQKKGNEKGVKALEEKIKTETDRRKKEDELIRKKHNATIDSLKEDISIRENAAKQALSDLSDEQKRQEEITKKQKLLDDLKKTQINGFQNEILGANKALTGLGDTIKGAFGETTIGKSLSIAGKGIGAVTGLFKKVEDPEIKKQKKELAILKGEKPEAEKTKTSFLLKPLGIEKILAKQEEKEKLLDPKTPQKVEIVSQPKDVFAEEKAKESAHIQEEQAETQERIANALEKEDQTVKVEGKDTGIFGKILSGSWNPLKAIQGIVSGIFGIINEFIKGVGDILKSALTVVKNLVKGVGDILLTLVDIVGKGFVKIMGFAGQGIAALFKALGSIPPQALLIGAAAIGVLTLAFMGLGKGLQMMTPAIKELATIPFDNFLSLAGGLLVLTPALIAFGVGSAIATPGFFGLALGVGALGVALRILAPAIETIIPPITDMVGGLGNFVTTVGTAMSNFITSFAQSMVLLSDADFIHLAGGFVALGVALAGFGVAAAIAIPSLLALGSASSGLANLIDVPPDRFDALRESFKLLGKAVKEFAKDAKGLGGAVLAMGALSAIPFANKLLKTGLETTETRNVVDSFRGGIAEAIQPVDIVSFSGARTERGVEMLRQAAETVEIRDETAMNAAGANVVTTAVTDASSVTNNAIVVQDSPTDSGFRASVGTYGP